MNATENVLSTKSTSDLTETSNAKVLVELLSVFTKD